VLWTLDRLGLSAHRHEVLAVGAILDRGHRFEEGEDVVPLDVMACRVAKNLLQRVAMMAVESG